MPAFQLISSSALPGLVGFSAALIFSTALAEPRAQPASAVVDSSPAFFHERETLDALIQSLHAPIAGVDDASKALGVLASVITSQEPIAPFSEVARDVWPYFRHRAAAGLINHSFGADRDGKEVEAAALALYSFALDLGEYDSLLYAPHLTRYQVRSRAAQLLGGRFHQDPMELFRRQSAAVSPQESLAFAHAWLSVSRDLDSLPILLSSLRQKIASEVSLWKEITDLYLAAALMSDTSSARAAIWGLQDVFQQRGGSFVDAVESSVRLRLFLPISSFACRAQHSGMDRGDTLSVYWARLFAVDGRSEVEAWIRRQSTAGPLAKFARQLTAKLFSCWSSAAGSDYSHELARAVQATGAEGLLRGLAWLRTLAMDSGMESDLREKLTALASQAESVLGDLFVQEPDDDRDGRPGSGGSGPPRRRLQLLPYLSDDPKGRSCRHLLSY